MVANRGFDVRDSKSRDLLLEATETLLTKEGGHAISARRVADQAGLKPQLVHYYFRSMEDLLIATFDRATEQYMALHDEALASPHPLHAIWRLNHVNRSDTSRNIEFVALGNRHERLRERMLAAGEHFRALQIKAVEEALEKAPVKSHYSAAGIAMMIAAVARTIVMENRLGISLAHADLCELMETMLDEIEPNGAATNI
ncbi:MAG TPA: TetR/AcrR family transcriptional regulator [Sphingobium sp.]|uniref:TetR/AcrR family transcriptional regulator n=1 Tax=Sphingobium sp. TaxID=1912891 RepID=UPI002ED3973F